jgi:2-polyprenyl-6-methoxyphenol hydroxylase-like FAD-dependent oxidoreductase
MRIVCVGGGPAGLYFSILMKRRGRDHEVMVLERNPAGRTYGWGVVYWDDLLASLQDSDPETAREIVHSSCRWAGQTVHVEGKPTVHLDGDGYGIGRQRLLDILVRRATDLGVRVRFEHEVGRPGPQSGGPAADADLVVACDGANSRLRSLHAGELETNVVVGRNKYIWLGTTRVFDAFTFAFVRTPVGWIWFHAYGFDGRTSTCIVECAPETWEGLGFDGLEDDETLARLATLFEEHLDGHPLLGHARDGGRTPWLNFRTVTNRRWHHGSLVLMGDAAHTTHFSIGSGTSLALMDAIGLATSLERHRELEVALRAYGRERRAALLLAQSEARNSARWFESIPRYIGLPSSQFAVLLKQRRWPLVSRIPPTRYCQLYQAAHEVAMLRRLGRWVRGSMVHLPGRP